MIIYEFFIYVIMRTYRLRRVLILGVNIRRVVNIVIRCSEYLDLVDCVDGF